jgi:hypothetical protein
VPLEDRSTNSRKWTDREWKDINICRMYLKATAKSNDLSEGNGKYILKAA